jgi:hypothetical protein
VHSRVCGFPRTWQEPKRGPDETLRLSVFPSDFFLTSRLRSPHESTELPLRPYLVTCRLIALDFDELDERSGEGSPSI